MSRQQRIANYAYLCLMSLGALIALYGIFSAVTRFGEGRDVLPDWRWWDYPVLSSGVTGAILFLMTLAFFAIFIRRGTNLFAPFVYVVSYTANAYAFLVLFVAIEKRGAPGPALTMKDVFTESVLLGPALLVMAAGLFWNYKTALRKRAL